MKLNQKVICAGCSNKFFIDITVFYRNKRWCGKDRCKEIIDYKVKHSNYKKARNKMAKGTFRHGVPPSIREYIKNRDGFTCRMCFNKLEQNVMQVHHIIPVANGGHDINTNLVLVCYDCHTHIHKTGWENYVKKLEGYTKKIENATISK